MISTQLIGVVRAAAIKMKLVRTKIAYFVPFAKLVSDWTVNKYETRKIANQCSLKYLIS